MSEAPKVEAAPPAAEGKEKKKLSLKLIGAVVGLAGAGAVLAMVALPKKNVSPLLEGPFYVSLTEEPIPVSTVDNNNRRYVKFAVDAEFRAYQESYVNGRRSDPFFAPTLRSRIERSASNKTIKEITEGLNRDTFAEALREELDAVIFPLHIGSTRHPLDKDEKTGLRPGISRDQSTFRGRFHEHVLFLDGPRRRIRVDQGPEASFTGEEEDLLVETAQGEVLYVDVTHYEREFVGEVHVGVQGHLRRIILHDTIAQ